MPKCHLHKIVHSVFTKLLVIIILAGFGINVALIFLFGAFRYHIASSYQPHLARYIGYLVNELGTPPNFERAQRIASDTHMVITYYAPEPIWSTAETPLDWPDDCFRTSYQTTEMQVRSYHGLYEISVRLANGRLNFQLPYQGDAEKKIHILGIGLLIYITLLMVFAFLLIRWVLRPLHWLRKGVTEVSHGVFSHRVPVGRSDELGDLAFAFNTMTDRIHKLIQSKEQLLLDVSHELRTPITRIKVALAMMDQNSSRQNIEEDVKELEQKVTELLETARAVNVKTRLNLEITDLMVLINKAIAVFAGVGPGIQIKGPQRELRLAVDRRQMTQVFKNVLDNALKFSPEDGRPVTVALEKDNAQAIITICDNGVGIPEADLPFVFEPFFRVKKARTPGAGGYGLGLSLVKTIVEAHSGCISIKSKLKHGTSVRIQLPIDQETT